MEMKSNNFGLDLESMFLAYTWEREQDDDSGRTPPSFYLQKSKNMKINGH